MVIGDEHALSGRRAYLRLTVLETDPEVCGRGWARVRFEEGILAGQEKRVPSRESLLLARSVTVRRRTVCPSRARSWSGGRGRRSLGSRSSAQDGRDPMM
jgi:hypothetical protein